MEPIDALRETKALLSDPWRWVQHLNFADRAGQRAIPQDAERFCVLGGLAAVEGRGTYGSRTPAERALSRAIYGHDSGSIVGWNDAPERTHEDVIAALDEAMLLLAGERRELALSSHEGTPDA